MSDTKHCPKCGRDLPKSEFHRDRSRPDGLYSYCKQCNYAHVKLWCEQNPERATAYRKQYRREHLEELREYGRRKSKERFQDNPEVYREYCATRRARIRAAHGELFSVQEVRDRLAEFGELCVYCGAPFEHLDHLIPISGGGGGYIANLVPACARCNLSKYDKDALVWFREQPFYTEERAALIRVLLRGAAQVKAALARSWSRPAAMFALHKEEC